MKNTPRFLAILIPLLFLVNFWSLPLHAQSEVEHFVPAQVNDGCSKFLKEASFLIKANQQGINIGAVEAFPLNHLPPNALGQMALTGFGVSTCWSFA